jgi:N-acetylglucosamine malate deacetylase 1
MNILVIAPHPDDETLGCGGTILKHKSKKNNIDWLIVTKIKNTNNNSKKIKNRENEIKKVKKLYGFRNVVRMQYDTSTLDTIVKKDIIKNFRIEIDKIKPNIIYLPFKNDAHSDHRITFESVFACTKSFRAPYVKSIRVYETISETDFSNPLIGKAFQPNLWIDVSNFLEKKIKIAKIYKSEILKHPFPRSIKNIRALAISRGASAGCKYAEAFCIIKEIK